MPKTNNGYILLHRSLLDWEWYSDINTTRLFLHLLMTANFEDSNFRGVKVPAGGRICSISKLGKECHLSDMQIRTALKHLEETGSITRYKNPKFTVVTLNNWVEYQDTKQAIAKSANKRRNKQLTSKQQQIKEYNKEGKEYKEEKGCAELPDGIPLAVESPEERARRIADLMR